MEPEQVTTTVDTSNRVPWRLVIFIALIVVGLIFIFQNTASGRVEFFFWKVDAPAWIWFFALLAIGFVAGVLFPKIRARRNKE